MAMAGLDSGLRHVKDMGIQADIESIHGAYILQFLAHASLPDP